MYLLFVVVYVLQVIDKLAFWSTIVAGATGSQGQISLADPGGLNGPQPYQGIKKNDALVVFLSVIWVQATDDCCRCCTSLSTVVLNSRDW